MQRRLFLQYAQRQSKDVISQLPYEVFGIIFSFLTDGVIPKVNAVTPNFIATLYIFQITPKTICTFLYCDFANKSEHVKAFNKKALADNDSLQREKLLIITKKYAESRSAFDLITREEERDRNQIYAFFKVEKKVSECRHPRESRGEREQRAVVMMTDGMRAFCGL
jgi:hypothetical protein